jgi:hypothetical protein
MSKYYCEKCHYSTDLKNSYNKHLLSIKHLSENVYNFKCECNKEFQTKSGLSKHKLNCNIRPIINQVINTPIVDIRTQIREVLNEILEKKDKSKVLLKSESFVTKLAQTLITLGVL